MTEIFDYLPLFINAGFSFSSDWFFANVGTKMDEVTMRDPLKRIEASKKNQMFLRKRYPNIYPSTNPVHDSPGIGIGVVTMPLIFGAPIDFKDHMDPHALPIIKPEESVRSIKPPNLKDAMQWLYSEIDTLVDQGYKKSDIGLPNMQGELNVATKIVGDNRMLGLIARKNKEDDVNYILNVVSDAIIDVYSELRKELGRSKMGDITIAGCTHYYLSPDQWTKFVLPQVRKYEVIAKGIGLHHCGLTLTDKVRALAHYPWTHVEMGFGSDLKEARKAFIHPKLGPVPFSCRISPYRMLNQPAEQITKDVNWIIENAKGGPVSINVVGVPKDTPNENIYAMRDAVEAYNKKKEEEDED
jgi:uroporphyrinogen-III decarboxylase